MAKDEFDAFMEEMSGGHSRLARTVRDSGLEQMPDSTPERREALLESRNRHRGRPVRGSRRVSEYKNKTFRISKDADCVLSKIAVVSGKPFKDLLGEAIEHLAKKYKL